MFIQKRVCTFAAMTTKEQLEERHQKAIDNLKKVAKGKIYVHGLYKTAKIIAENLDLSTDTVINYVSGRTKDGFLTDAIAKEYKTLKL